MGFVLMSVLMVGMLTVWGPTSPGQVPAPPQQQAPAWEYKFVELGFLPNDFEKAFHDQGKAGWEYCETREIWRTRAEDEKLMHKPTVIIFKRQVGAIPPAPK